MTIMFDYTKTLSELEGITMEEPEFKSSLTLKCYELYNTPLCELEFDK